jgi:hypothetical protein
MREDDNHIDINFKGYYFNSLQNNDSKIELSPPTPLPKNSSESQKNMVNETANPKTTTSKNSKSEN